MFRLNIEYPVLVIGPGFILGCSFNQSDSLRFVTAIKSEERRLALWHKEQ